MPRLAVIDETRTTAGVRPRASRRAAPRSVYAAPAAFTAKSRWMVASSVIPSIPAACVPALTTSASSRLKFSNATRVRAVAVAGSAMSPAAGTTVTPNFSDNSVAARFTASAPWPCSTRSYPRSARRWAVARPMPREAPVTRATRSRIDIHPVLAENAHGLVEARHVDHVIGVDHHREFIFNSGNQRHVRQRVPLFVVLVTQIVDGGVRGEFQCGP